MPGLFTIAFADLASRRLTTALTVVAVMLGTAVVVAAFTTNAAVEQSMREAAAASVGDAHLIVEAVDERGFESSSLRSVAALDGVHVVAPQLQRRVAYRAGGDRGFAHVLGVDPAYDPLVHPYVIGAGRQLDAADASAALVGAAWARARSIDVGSTIDLITTDGFRPFVVVGLLDEADAAVRGAAAVVRIPLKTAQGAFGAPDRVDRLAVVLSDAAFAANVTAHLPGALPYIFTVRDRAQVLDDMLASIRDLQVALGSFGAIALVAGGLLVYNTLSLTVVERTQQIGLLRAIGASTTRVVQLMLAQGVLLGVAGALAGAALGQILAVVLATVTSRVQGLELVATPFSPEGLAAGAALGVAVTLTATVLPAIRAGRTPPLAAMNATRASATAGVSGKRTVMTAAAAALMLAVLLAPLPADVGRAAKAIAAAALLPLLFVLSSSIIPVVAAAGAILVRRISRGAGVVAERMVTRERGQTTVTVASFLVGLGLIVALANGSASFSAAGQRSAEALFPGEIVVVSPVDQSLELVTEFDAIPGVEQVSALTWQPVTWQGMRLTAAGVEPAHYFQAFDILGGDRIEPYRSLRRGEGVLIPASLAREMELAVGDKMPIAVKDFATEFRVAGIIARSLPTDDGYGAIILPRDVLDRIHGIRSFRFLAVSVAPGADAAVVARDVARTAESFGMQGRAKSELSESIATGIGALFALLGGLVAIAVVVGALGLANAMVLNLALRSREVGIMRAVGLARAQVRGLAIAEASLLGAVGATLAVILGALLAWVMAELTRTPEADVRFVFSPAVAGGVLVAGVGIAAISALYPAWRAARMDILAALREG